jgi:polar amino acid transport system substrate-binding protein
MRRTLSLRQTHLALNKSNDLPVLLGRVIVAVMIETRGRDLRTIKTQGDAPGRRGITTIRTIRFLLLLILVASLSGAKGTAAPAATEIQQVLAPTGSLRVALYTGTPTSVLSSTDMRGVGYDLGKELARRLNVPFQPIVFTKNADVLEAVKAGRADVAFTNASPERAKDMDFTQPYLLIELGYLARDKSPVAALANVDQQGVRVGVTANSSSDAELSHNLKNAQVVRAETVKIGVQMLSAGTLDLYATNKATLFEMGDQLPGAHVLDGSWGYERHALAIPKGRDAGLPYVRAFITDAIASGLVKTAVANAGLRGAVVASSVP